MFKENKSAVVFNRPQYTGEEAYIKPAVYHCINCGAATHSKEERLEHATICGMEEEKGESIGNIAVLVDNEKESWAVQEVFFKLGYGWVDDGKKYVDCYSEITWIYLEDKDMFLTGCDVTLGDKKIITSAQFLSMFGDPQDSDQEDSTVTMPESCRSYRKPKLVKALWLGKTYGEIEVETFQNLINYSRFIGCVYEEHWRFIIVNGGSERKKAVAAKETLSGKQESVSCKYYIFESARDLYLWMAEGEA